MTRSPIRIAIFALVFGLLGSTARTADPVFLISANDNKSTLVDGVTTVPANVQPDTVSIFDLSAKPPKLVAELRAPASVVGPPQSVAIAPDQSIALVTGALKLDPADRTKTVPNDTLTVIDLRASPPVVLTTLHAGRQASGVSINRAGTLALIANRAEGSVSVFTIQGKNVAAAGKVDLGAPDSGPSHVAFTPDGRIALVTRNNDHLISIVSIENNHASYTKRDIASGLKPYGIEVTPAGDVALAANVGAGPTGGADTISVIDLKQNPPRAVDQVAAGPTVEGLSIAPDGRFVAVTVMNGSNAPRASGFLNDFGVLKVFSINGTALAPVASAHVGHWCQGAAWSPDAHTVFVQCMVEKEIQMFDFDGRTLKPAGALKVNGSPAGMRTAK